MTRTQIAGNSERIVEPTRPLAPPVRQHIHDIQAVEQLKCGSVGRLWLPHRAEVPGRLIETASVAMALACLRENVRSMSALIGASAEMTRPAADIQAIAFASLDATSHADQGTFPTIPPAAPAHFPGERSGRPAQVIAYPHCWWRLPRGRRQVPAAPAAPRGWPGIHTTGPTRPGSRSRCQWWRVEPGG